MDSEDKGDQGKREKRGLGFNSRKSADGSGGNGGVKGKGGRAGGKGKGGRGGGRNAPTAEYKNVPPPPQLYASAQAQKHGKNPKREVLPNSHGIGVPPGLEPPTTSLSRGYVPPSSVAVGASTGLLAPSPHLSCGLATYGPQDAKTLIQTYQVQAENHSRFFKTSTTVLMPATPKSAKAPLRGEKLSSHSDAVTPTVNSACTFVEGSSRKSSSRIGGRGKNNGGNNGDSSISQGRWDSSWPGTSAEASTPAGKAHATPASRAQATPGTMNGKVRKVVFEEYWSQEAVSQGLKLGKIFRGNMRINAYRRQEGYVTLEGVTPDLLIEGVDQNRTIEGDSVAIKIYPFSRWLDVDSGKTSAGKRNGAGDRKTVGQSATATPQATPAKTSAPLAPGEARAAETDLQPTLLDLAGFELSRLSVGEATPSPLAAGAAAASSSPSDGESWTPPMGTACTREAVLAALKVAVKDSGKRAVGRVVALLESSPRRETIVGTLKVEGQGYWKLTPADLRIPVCRVDEKQIPSELRQAHECGTLGNLLIGGRIQSWKASSMVPFVTVRSTLGQAGEIDSETAALVFEHSLPPDDFDDEVLQCLPPTPWIIPEEQRSQRRALQGERIFSIDPPTARDLDDALSIKPLQEGGWEVGVHIADVAHFIPPQSALDAEARQRSTSTYLTQKVIPMLPRLLCEELCSLNPGVERFAFSVVWRLCPKGKVVSEWFGRSVIKSCVKLSYGEAQRMIETEGEADKGPLDWGVEAVELHNGYSWEDVAGDVRALHGLATELRRERFEDSGSLRLDNSKLYFTFDECGNPVEAMPYVTREANHLVEEFMLLANRRVGLFISQAFPDRAVLRRHPPPNPRKLEGLIEFCSKMRLDLDVSSSGALNRSLQQIRQIARDTNNPGLGDVLTLLATKPMQLAQYFCTGDLDEAEWAHYALSFPHYTHFTSPIRRYPDVLVHRLLAAALQVKETCSTHTMPPDSREVVSAAEQHGLLDPEAVAVTTQHANDRKLAAKNAQDDSSKIFLCVMLRSNPKETMAVVHGLGPKYLGTYLPEYGMEVRVDIDPPAIGHSGLEAKYSPQTEHVQLVPQGANFSACRKRGGRRSSAGEGGGSSEPASDATIAADAFLASLDAAEAFEANLGEAGAAGGAASTPGKMGAVKGVEGATLGVPETPPPAGTKPRAPLTIRKLQSVPVRLTSKLQPGKKPEVIASLLVEKMPRH
ncbi:hypothetical protein CYMTET_13581 [Cymbomonas tetramitiformis]|uniref:DIS3-like exonuclease 2 n=1 Tax=Cymbomonas tetramitiformis TaxID=36881 RepID=A0AAE0GI69_9CHLO|nr:hypothetical protein CYMTET_13581 [Cymbomonas tetramitiformis]